ncbi:DEAD/DEAH box helicase [Polynucleobacter necessarius]|uniref:DEAD/DEAH box helicase n=1 Tax=Polynucleobacter necessarius TaxID=576610 RepID=UPI000E08DF5C|nr:DEAD/DEAH box helicase [Polynucleobacter necessarius]
MTNTATEINSSTGVSEVATPSVTNATTADTSATITFADFGLDSKIQKAVLEQGYTTPTPIQAKSIPHVLAGSDLMGAAQTGTGKTATFVLPIIQKILRHASNRASPAHHPIRALVLTPTRELAVQVAENAANYSKYTDLRATVVYGGVNMKEQVGILRNGVEILIATPGRLLDHIGSKVANLSQVEILVLDEADRMLDMGFLPDLQRIINLIPAQRQTLLFSATFSPEIKKLAQSYLRTPVIVEVARQNAAADTVKQVVHMVSSADKQRAIVDVLEARTRAGLSRQCIIFTNSRLGCAKLSRALERDGMKAGAIHGDKSQVERTLTLDAFKSGAIEALVATDVAARGLDIPDMPCVINHELPFNAEDFVHRIGRTGRAGSQGDAIALVDPSEKRLLDEIEKLMQRKLDVKPLPQGVSSSSCSHSGCASAKMSDPFFYNPYEPSAPSASASATTEAKSEEKKVGITPAKPAVGALLGGFKQK